MTTPINVRTELATLKRECEELRGHLAVMRSGGGDGTRARGLYPQSFKTRAAADQIAALAQDPAYLPSLDRFIGEQHDLYPSLDMPADTADLLTRFNAVVAAWNGFWAIFDPKLNEGVYDQKPRVTRGEDGSVTGYNGGTLSGSEVQASIAGANGDWAEADAAIASLDHALGVA